jgi:two-component system OmpR family response regulator
MKVLYVDDDDFIREVAEMALGLDAAMEVKVAEDGPSALRLLSGGDWRPALLLLDVMMPGMDGPELLQEARKLDGYGDIPAIFVTARAQPHEHTRLLEAGPLGILTKPFDPLTFAAQVRELAPNL